MYLQLAKPLIVQKKIKDFDVLVKMTVEASQNVFLLKKKYIYKITPTRKNTRVMHACMTYIYSH